MVKWLIRPVGHFKENQFATGCFLVYIAVAFLLLFFHEPWRDELQCWVIAKESTSFFEMLHMARYEGHPSAWYTVLFFITRFTNSFLVVRLCHLLLMATVALLILFKSPFSKIQKCLLIFGYFFIYEYAALTRNYAIGILALLLICILFKHRKKYWLHICGLLFLIMQVNVFAAILGCAFFIPFFIDGFLLLKKNNSNRNLNSGVSTSLADTTLTNGKYIAGTLLFIGGFLLTVFDMMPPPDSTFMPEWKWAAPEWQHALSSFFHAMAPLPKLELHFWNTHILQGLVAWEWLPTLESILATLLLACCVFSLRKNYLALSFFLLAWLAISVFLSVKYVGFMRHHGHYFIAYVLALWIKKDEAQTGSKKDVFLSAILSVHVLAAVIAIYFEVKFPFTQSEQVAAFIEKKHEGEPLLVGHFDYATSPIGFHLNRPVFYPNQNQQGTFIYWSKKRFEKDITDIVKTANAICRENGSFMLITSYPLPGLNSTDCTIELVKKFIPAVVKEEEYWLYKVVGDNSQ